jgi:hypothetical protein
MVGKTMGSWRELVFELPLFRLIESKEGRVPDFGFRDIMGEDELEIGETVEGDSWMGDSILRWS